MLTLAQGYVAYGFGWVMDKQEAAQLEARYDDADREKRAHSSCTSARAA